MGHLKADYAGVQAMAKDLRRQLFVLYAKYGILTGRMPTHFGFERVTIARDDSRRTRSAWRRPALSTLQNSTMSEG